jgi:hypothetical protein
MTKTAWAQFVRRVEDLAKAGLEREQREREREKLAQRTTVKR